jgi:hypothetical protein
MTGVLRLCALGAPLVLLLSACGPFTYVSRVTFGATPEMARARVTNAEKLAPYEYTAATEYLRKSKELAGYARFHDANTFGKKARELADKSQKVARKREKNDELPIYRNDGSMYITREGAVRKGSPDDAANQAVDSEKPSLDRLDSEKPNMNRQQEGAK